MFADVLFPLKTAPFTYSVPEGIDNNLVGRIVSVSLANRVSGGLVVGMHNTPPPAGSVTKPIRATGHDFASPAMLRLLTWLSGYYMVPSGLALKSAFFDEAAASLKPVRQVRRGSKKETSPSAPHELPGLSESWRSAVARQITEGTYSALVWQTPDVLLQHAGVLALSSLFSSAGRGIVILAPEIRTIDLLTPHFSDAFKERLVILHGKLTPKERVQAINRILDGSADIVLGTRSAILAPLPAVTLVAVIDEHSRSYKAEEGLRYNARDVAVMRGYLEGCPVLLSSCTPSIETMHNCGVGKYRMLRLPAQDRPRRPSVQVIRRPFRQLLAREAVAEAKTALRNRRSLLVLAGRTGYGIVGCSECGEMISCPDCKTASVFHRKRSAVRCHHCGKERPLPAFCGSCGGHALAPFSMGTERVDEELRVLLGGATGTASLTVEEKAESSPERDVVPFIVTAGRSRKSLRRYSSVLLLHADLLLSRPDFRAHERLFQEVAGVMEAVEPGGTVMLQTASPAAPVMRFIRQYDYAGFCAWELKQREAMGHPPFRKMIRMILLSQEPLDAAAADLERHIAGIRIEGVEIFGPLEVPPTSRRYKASLQVLFASSRAASLREAVRSLSAPFEKEKGVKVVIDVDPLEV